jgi:hypothetical protein
MHGALRRVGRAAACAVKKIIVGSLLVLFAPQVLVVLFFLFAGAVLGWTPELRYAWVFVSGVVLVFSLLTLIGCLLRWVDQYRQLEDIQREVGRIGRQVKSK